MGNLENKVGGVIEGTQKKAVEIKENIEKQMSEIKAGVDKKVKPVMKSYGKKIVIGFLIVAGVVALSAIVTAIVGPTLF